MAILKIARMGHPVLARPADPVADPTAPEVRRLIDDMTETLRDAAGLGLAAPQVHEPWRVVLYRLPPARSDDGRGRPLTVLINPVLTVEDPTPITEWEACLSLPGLTGAVPRPRAVRLNALDAEGRSFELRADGHHARVLQHECDHLDGILYPQRMTDLARFGFVDDIKRRLAADQP
ncbi:peptide deformylase [Roseospirillum parvum]|uniref:Peptide deformylase n=1 Tax=Roseospirillum parvum TaxID=83401 RepID=A0A1G7U0G3_9PROT|nr:peptide deformylase [Roseospirillum parvum]SDG41033.1 peptide deformylase [Roseospirillum parvum]